MANATPTQTGNHSNISRAELIDILSTFQKVSLSVPYFIVEPLALLLNFLTLFIIWNREKQMRRPSNTLRCQNTMRSQLRTYYFLRHLVFSDLLTCFFAIPIDTLEIYHRRFHQYCAVLKYVRYVAHTTNFYMLVVTNFERFWSLTFPFRQLSATTVVYMIRGAWLTAFLFNIPSFFLFHSKVKYLRGNDYYARVCEAKSGMGKAAFAYFGLTFSIPAIVVAALSMIIVYRVVRIEKESNRHSPQTEDSNSDSPNVNIRGVVLLSTYITAGFWLCISPAGIYFLTVAVIGLPQFPTSYLITRSLAIVVDAKAVVNPLITITCFPPIKERAKKYLGLGARESYSMKEGKNKANAEETHGVELLALRIRSSFRKVRFILKGTVIEDEKKRTEGASRTVGQTEEGWRRG